jgi:hypothetical protein
MSHEFAHELRRLFEVRVAIWRGYDGADGRERMESTRGVDILIARLSEAEQERIDAAIRGKQ